MFKRILFLVSLILIGGARLVQADTELWSVNTFQHSLGERTKLNLIPELRLKNNAADLYYVLLYIGPTLSLNKSFDLNLFYAPKFTKNGGGWSNSGMGYLDFICKNGNLTNRGRFEYDFTADLLKYRDQLQARWGSWQAAEELFFNFRTGYIDETRTPVSYVFKPYDRFELAVGYLLRGQKKKPNDDWTWTNVINLGTKVLF